MAFLYHASPMGNRSSILRHGMIAHKEGNQLWMRTASGLQPKGNYGYEDPMGARAFAEGALFHRLGIGHVDIWKMDVSGMKVLFDPEIREIQKINHPPKWVHEALAKGKTPPRWYVPHHVESHRLDLYETIDCESKKWSFRSRRMKHISMEEASALELPVWPHD